MADAWTLDAEQAIIITLKKMLGAGHPLDGDKVQEAAVKALVDMAGGNLSESDARRPIRSARDRLVTRGDIDAPLEAGRRWRLLRQ
jgi:hypothetical protein